MLYGFVLVRLYQGRIKSGLVLAAAMGCNLFVPGASYFALLSNGKGSWWIQTNLAPALLMQPVLVAAAIWTVRSIQRAPRNLFQIPGSSAYGIALIGLFWIAYSPVLRLITYREHGSMAKYRLGDMSGTALPYAEGIDGFYQRGHPRWSTQAGRNAT
jgi:hypothetical protein